MTSPLCFLDKMEVRICARCISTKMIQNFNIKLSDMKCIWDLKKILELKLSVAACDQRIYYEKRLLEDRKSLSSLYVKKGDSFDVEFLACCNIEKLRSMLDGMKKFLETVCESYSGVETLSSVTENRDQFNDYCRDVCKVLALKRELFSPWHSEKSVANRHYFAQEGGLDILSSIYKFAQKTFRVSENHSTGVEETEMLKSVTHNQKILEYSCLGAVWSYSELEEDRRIILKKIGLDMFMKSLIRNPWQADELDPEVININECAVGCLSQYIEMPDIQQFVAEHLEAVTKIVWLVSNGTSLSRKGNAAITLFCCSIHPKAALKLLENKVHQSVITKMMPLLSISGNNEKLMELGSNLSTAMQYFFCLFLANIENLPNKKILTDQENIDEVIEKFLSLHAPSEIGAHEVAHRSVWISMVPYVELALSSCNVKTLQSGQTKLQLSSAAKVGLFSLCHLTKSRVHLEIFKREKLVDYLVCIRWFAKNCEGNSLVPDLTEFGEIEPPQLQSIAKAYLAKFYGHRIR